MPPRRRAPAPIPVDVEGVRRKLAEGKIVRVGISKSAQFPDGATGRVRHVGDPAVDGEEFVQVELSLNGTRDILPFTPADLTPATRGRPPGTAHGAAGGNPGRPAQAGVSAKPKSERRTALTSVPTGDRSPDVSANGKRDPILAASSSAASHQVQGSAPAVQGPTPLPPANAPMGTAGSADRTLRTPVAANPEPDRTIRSSIASAPARSTVTTSVSPAKSARGPRRTPNVAITIATTDTEPTQWKIEARVGARVALRAGSVAPARVWELVRLLENEALTKAVGSILDDQRKAAQARADALAAELAQVRAELDALPDGAH